MLVLLYFGVRHGNLGHLRGPLVCRKEPASTVIISLTLQKCKEQWLKKEQNMDAISLREKKSQ